MSLKRTIYRIAGKDYEQNEWVTNYTILTPKNSTQVIKQLIKKHKLNIKSIANHSTFEDEAKKIVISGFPSNICELFEQEFNLNDYSNLRDNFTARNNCFKLPSKSLIDRVNFYSKFNPKTRTTEIKANAPIKMETKQAVLNGMLWRKLPVNY